MTWYHDSWSLPIHTRWTSKPLKHKQVNSWDVSRETFDWLANGTELRVWNPSCSRRSNLAFVLTPRPVCGMLLAWSFMIRRYSSTSVLRSDWNQATSLLSLAFCTMLLFRREHGRQWSFNAWLELASTSEIFSSQFLGSWSTVEQTKQQRWIVFLHEKRDYICTH